MFHSLHSVNVLCVLAHNIPSLIVKYPVLCVHKIAFLPSPGMTTVFKISSADRQLSIHGMEEPSFTGIVT
jgi:hypothetical protein